MLQKMGTMHITMHTTTHIITGITTVDIITQIKEIILQETTMDRLMGTITIVEIVIIKTMATTTGRAMQIIILLRIGFQIE